MFHLADELFSVTERLDQSGIPYALVGGIAYSMWVEIRNTQDIDFLVKLEYWDEIADVLAPLGYEQLAAPMDLSNIRIRRLTKLEEKRVFILDFLLADTKDLAEGVDQAPLLSHEGRNLKVASPEVIIFLKKGRMSPQDQIDIEGLEKLIEENGS